MPQADYKYAINKLTQALKDGSVDGELMGPVSEKRIQAAEKKLGYKFSPMFRDFVSRFGQGYFGGTLVMGVSPKKGKDDSDWGVNKTLAEREEGMSHSLFCIDDEAGEYIYCLQFDNRKPAKEAPVVAYYPVGDADKEKFKPDYKDFGAYLRYQVDQAFELGD
jgi:antitoxin YobK